MKTLRRMGSGCAYTLVELLMTILAAMVVFLVLLPQSHCHCKSVQINCVNNLKQVGLAFRLWSGDNNDMYPMRALTNSTGALLFADETNGFRYFLAMSNELNTPKILSCPADTRIPATNFGAAFNGKHISFFVGLQADETLPTAFLAGDRNITNGLKSVNGILELTTNQNISWTQDLHNNQGNIGLADGSVQKVSNNALKTLVAHTGFATNRLLMP
jgi:prepilin-type processing-associated H-X9-DG protein